MPNEVVGYPLQVVYHYCTGGSAWRGWGICAGESVMGNLWRWRATNIPTAYLPPPPLHSWLALPASHPGPVNQQPDVVVPGSNWVQNWEKTKHTTQDTWDDGGCPVWLLPASLC